MLLLLGASLTADAGGVVGATPIEPEQPSAQASATQATLFGNVVLSQHADNETIHEHPDDAREDGDTAALADWLAGELGSMLDESTIQLSEGEHELARNLVGDRYDERLEQYVEIQDETGREDEGETVRELERAGENQRTLATESERYEETYEEYEEAKEAGDDERTRELARELDAIADRANESATNLTTILEEIAERTGADVTEQRTRIESTRGDIVTRQREVRGETFTETELSATAASSTISAREPLFVTGQLTTEDGHPVANGTIRLELDETTTTTTTNQTGEFAISHRPTIDSLDTENATLRYEPAPASTLYESETSIDVDIEQVEATLELTNVTRTVAFEDSVIVHGVVSAGEFTPGGVPVVVELDGDRLGSATTSSDGTFVLESSLPVTVPSGDRSLRAMLSLDEQALSSAESTTTVTISETATTLSLTTSQSNDTSFDVEGTLETVGGTGVADQRIALYADDRRIDTVETASNGSFAATIDVGPVTDAWTRSVSIEAVYVADGTNLGDARSSETVAVTPPGYRGWIVEHWWLILALSIGVLAVVLGSLAIGYSRRGWFDGWFGVTTDGHELSEQPAVVEPPAPDDPHPDAMVPLDAARERSAAGEFDRAAELAYGAVRGRLGRHLTNGAVSTHWEFFVQCTDADLPADPDALRTLTERYERAAFAPASLTAAEATAAIDAAARLVESG